jgi:hypothetical protein
MLQTLIQREHRRYLAGKSDASLEQVCDFLEQTLALDPFDHDAGDTGVFELGSNELQLSTRMGLSWVH